MRITESSSFPIISTDSSSFLEGEPSGDARLQYAIRRYHEARNLFPDSYDLKFIGHKIAIKEGDMTQAEQYFDELRRQFPDHEPLKEYLVEITNSVRHQTTDDNFMGFLEVDPKSTFINSTTKNCAFFLRLPARTQREILVHSAVRHEMSNKLVDACRLYVLLLKAYPDTATYFGVHAAQLAIECEAQNQPLSEYNSYRKLFGWDYLSIPVSTPTNYPQNVDVVYSELKLWLERAQGFYIASKDWKKLFEISLTVMDSTGYLVFPSSPRISLESFFEDPSQLYVKLFNLLNQKPVTFLTQETTQHSFCISIGIACFVHCCHEFYKLVSGSKNMSSEGKRNCLIPIWIEKVNTETVPTPPPSSIKTPTITTPIKGSTSNAHHLLHDDYDEVIDSRVSKKRRVSFLLTEDSSDRDKRVDYAHITENMNTEKHEVSRGKNVMNVRNLLTNDEDYKDYKNYEDIQSELWQDSFNLTITIVCDATVYLERALGCWDDLELMFRRGGNEPQNLDKDLDKEVNRQLKAWNLPLDVSNAVMLTRADCELTKGNISMALNNYREITSRISRAWGEYRTKESQKDHLKSLNDDILDQTFMDESSIKELSPLLLTFRVIYSISVLYRAIGLWAQAKVELCIILATVPFTPVDKDHFEKDDLYISNTKRNINFNEKYKHQRFKLMEVNQEGLVIRVIKELMACFEDELDKVEDPLMDKTIGNIIILSQFGWPYWHDRVLSQVIFPKIKSRGGLKYPDLLKFMYNVEILGEILELHRTSPDLEFSLNPVSENDPTPASTTLSIKILENRIENPIEIHINEIMVKFFRARLKDETYSNTNNTNLFNSMPQQEGYEIIETSTSDAQISKTISKSWKMNVSAINNKDNTESFSNQVRINNNKANIFYNCENMDEKEGL
ncbi:4896_t:CDS:10 [Diversispora eburnea]|uniref:Integrator complex subunit 10 n=1 Tax=Diversispora eburnea TaxID=1213867 RepID=A0A9N9G5J5_9GLOM|nr:4896_t:CDS:10 [Diversispora eburnea]